jgi:hypothetical protein
MTMHNQFFPLLRFILFTEVQKRRCSARWARTVVEHTHVSVVDVEHMDFRRGLHLLQPGSVPTGKERGGSESQGPTER